MKWADEPPARYTLHFEWPCGGRPRGPNQPRGLIAETVEDAKLEAAILYAGAGPASPPGAYRIVRGARRVVYRFPEAAVPRRA